MIKNKYWVIVGLCTGLIAVAGVGWRITAANHRRQLHKNPTNLTDVQGVSVDQPLRPTTDPNSISLNRAQSTAEKSPGLRVAPSPTSNNLGQLAPDPKGTSEGANSSSGSSSATPKAPDPSTFIQYDSYKNEKNALFGEIQVGTGDELTAGKKAAVYYKGWLTDGRLFDMTRPDKDGKPQPFVFTMGEHRVIAGWEQALSGMKVGGTRLLIVPPAVGYGVTGQDPIPGNAVLVFQVQLLAVQ